MRIAVASDIPLDSHRAHAINVIKTAGGFARLGHETTVLCRAAGDGTNAREAARLYAEPGLAWRLAEATTERGAARERAFGAWAIEEARRFNADALYARHFRAALAGVAAGLPTVLETHAYIGDTNPALAEAFDVTRDGTNPLSVSTISRRLADDYARRGADPDRLHVVPDGVDVALFSPPPGGPTPPDPLGAHARPRVLYAGHLYDYKGIPTLLDAARRLPDATVHLLGGADEDIARVRCRLEASGPPNARVHGRVPHAEVPRWLWHADVLVLPPSAREPSCAWTSPVKLGEYLASGTPIVASGIPALRDWLDETVVEWFEPDDDADLARAVRRTLDADLRDRRTSKARALARRFSYEARAGALLAAALDAGRVHA